MKTMNRSILTTAAYAAFALYLSVLVSCKKDNGITVTPITPPDTTLRISALSTTTLHYGDTLTIEGSNFSVTAANNTVTINDVAATVQSATAAELKVIVPAVGATGGEVKIKTGNQTASGGNITYVPDVYVAGSQNNAAHALAIYWKNGAADTLSTEESALTSICITGNDVYAAGSERINNLQLANYWKNGVKTTLGTGASVANAIAVNGNNVHVGGWEVVNGFDIPRYWKNGTGISVNVNDPIISQTVLGNGSCYGICVSANNIYAVGYYRNSQGRFSPWEFINGIIPANTIPNNDKHCFANAVFVSGSDEYVAGSQNNATTGLAMATIWKDGTATTLTAGTASVGVATAVFVVGNDVYVAGYEQEDYYHSGLTFAKYWKNGVPVKLSTASSAATGIAVFGNDVYVSGWENNGTCKVAKYWKNGVPVNLGNAVLNSAGNAIVVR
ncbi:hypothetical protein A8C56_20140 [Niabella ginsenosidivorans]|uniref:IPT/TIG domain-containing protein n=1 Tax=Niabella ginsenosidivorans TaxID=1176587 RepID=A0A1A9I5T3_9BACT|nr:IPT/TIG domain-containing protein [Niabella ginsenosidivorans]ANH82986.1 hypothetical protein A8C56_20140 [Niabella ginsenosidivorans]